MAVYATMWSNVGGLTYAEAKAVAEAKGGRLINNDSGGNEYASKTQQWAYEERTGVYWAGELAVWVGAERTDAGWFWSDGTPIENSFFWPDDVNADGDPSNDSPDVVAYGDFLFSFNPTDRWQEKEDRDPIVSTGYVMEYMTSNVVGTSEEDWVFGLGTNINVKLLGGDDKITFSSSSGVVDLGSGSDRMYWDGDLHNPSKPLIVIDGEGSDQVYIEYGTIKASLDAEDDSELYVYNGKVSYDTATQNIVSNGDSGYYQIVSSAEIGNDTVAADHLVLGAGNDTVRGFAVITGGRGDDTLTARQKAEGGKGNDTLIADNPSGRVRLLGEDGDDTLIIRTAGEMTGGSGSDTFRFEDVAFSTINDLGSSDRIDLTSLIGDLSGAEARSGGYLKITVSNGYTRGLIDVDGGGDNFVDLFALKGVFANIEFYIL